MAKAPKAYVFEIAADHIRAGWNGRAAVLPFTREDGGLVAVGIDGLECWEDGAEISLADLQRLFELVERECGARGIEAEFE